MAETTRFGAFLSSKPPRCYIGLACSFHDPAIAIVDHCGQVLFAEGAERSLQNKRAFNAPPDPFFRIDQLLDTYCDPDAEIVIAKSWSGAQLDWRKENRLLIRMMSGKPRHHFGLELGRHRSRAEHYLLGSLDLFQEANANAIEQAGNNLAFRIRARSPGWDREPIIRGYNHHYTHAAAACYSSPFSDAVCAVVDGWGEMGSTAFYHYRNGQLELLPTQPGDGSLGLFYAFLCEACGFDWLRGEEWKVMGLAAYGKPNRKQNKFLRSMLQPADLGLHLPADYPALLDRLLNLKRPGSPLESADLAHDGQQVFSDIITELLTTLFEHAPASNLVLTGGCALNSACNGQILERTPFSQLYVFPAPADDGNAVGAAILAHLEDHPPEKAPATQQTPYLGSTLNREAITAVKQHSGLRHRPLKDVIQVAALLAEGKIVGWLQGRAELGPRALGNRSILADPRDKEMKERINNLVKFRESFRPFAPAILLEHGEEYFEHFQPSPYMDRTLYFREERLEQVPAVVHEDGTGRLQTVTREQNERFYDLLKAFYSLTNVPLLLNTSFNIMGKPIVHTVEDALAVFLTTGLDVLVIEDDLFEKPAAV